MSMQFSIGTVRIPIYNSLIYRIIILSVHTFLNTKHKLMHIYPYLTIMKYYRKKHKTKFQACISHESQLQLHILRRKTCVFL